MDLNKIDLNKLNVFFSVVERKGVSRAAEQLLLTRSAVSQSIAALERAIDLRLFNRVGRKLVLTDDGKRLYRGVKRYRAKLEQTLHEMLDERHEVKGVIRVGTFPEFARSKLSDVITRFLAAHPKVQVKLLFASPSELSNLLTQNKIDIAFSIYSDDAAIATSERVYKEELVLVAQARHLPRKVTLATLSRAPIVDYYQNSVLMKRWMKHHFNAAPPDLNVRAYASSSDLVLDLVRSGAGLGVVPRYLAAADIESGALEVIEPKKSPLVDYIWLSELKSSYKNPAHLAFRDEVKRELSILDHHVAESNRALHI